MKGKQTVLNKNFIGLGPVTKQHATVGALLEHAV